MKLERFVLVALAGMLAVGCRAQQPDNAARDVPTAPQVVLTGNQQEDERTVRRLEEEARQLARTDGCQDDAQCAAVAIGAKACGGPRHYIPYCRLTTDTAALFAKADELHRAEDAYNRRYEIVSDCMLVVEPPVHAMNGVCMVRR